MSGIAALERVRTGISGLNEALGGRLPVGVRRWWWEALEPARPYLPSRRLHTAFG
jgi:hypothetical protein